MTITHPFHPFCGHELEIVKIFRGKEPRTLVRLPDGTHARIPIDWTDLEPASTVPIPVSQQAGLLELEGLRELALLLNELQFEPAAEEG